MKSPATPSAPTTSATSVSTVSGSTSTSGIKKVHEPVGFFEGLPILPAAAVEVGERINRGVLKDVYKCTWVGAKYALACLTSHDPVNVQAFYEEARMLTRYKHPSVIKIFAVMYDLPTKLAADMPGLPAPQGKSERPIRGMILEYCPTSLQDAVANLKATPFTDVEKYSIIRDIGNVLEMLHNEKPRPVIFRDIKTANILLSQTKQVKFIDFSQARAQTSKPVSKEGGTQSYHPPEEAAEEGRKVSPHEKCFFCFVCLFD